MTLTKRPRNAPRRGATDPGDPRRTVRQGRHLVDLRLALAHQWLPRRRRRRHLVRERRRTSRRREIGPPPSSEELVGRWCEAVGAGGAGRMLAVLAARYPATVDREALAASGGTFSTYLSRLVSNGLATRLPKGVRAAGELFPAGSEAR